MPVDIRKFNSPATKGDVAGVAIECVIAFRNVIWALQCIKAGQGYSEHVEAIEKSINSLDKTFDNLAGWTAEK